MIEEKYMRRCLELAEKGLGRVAPNPMVGAVIVHKGKIIGEGFHRKYGESHAEVNAINSVRNQDLLKESTIYVNLEPCSHYGKTPPCTKLIIEKQIPNVVIANKDPFPEVCGRGIKMLQEQGINVIEDFLAKEGEQLNRRFFTFHIQKRPYIILKWAQTANGFIDIFRNDSTTPPLHISSPETSILVHKQRTEESAILIGTKTALLDNPDLTVRKWYGKNPVRIVIDRKLQIPQNYKFYNGESPTIIFTEKKSTDVNKNIEHIQISLDDKFSSVQTILDILYKKNIQSVIVEGGKMLIDSFLESEKWDEMRVETALSLRIQDGIIAPSIKGNCTQREIIRNQLIERYQRN